jgi:hypothetical protein
MTKHLTGTREEWLAARLKLLATSRATGIGCCVTAEAPF